MAMTENTSNALGWSIAPTMTDHLEIVPPRVLYHYTNQRGYIGIVNSRSLWATDIRYLNDSHEHTYGVRLTLDRLQARIANLTSDTEITWIEEFYYQLKNYEAIDRAFKPKLFVASLSELSDDLAQWRAYSGPGSGFAIGFGQDTQKWPRIVGQGLSW